MKNGRPEREAPEFYLKQMLVYLDDQPISEFQMTSAVSANAVIRFALRGSGAAPFAWSSSTARTAAGRSRKPSASETARYPVGERDVKIPTEIAATDFVLHGVRSCAR